MNSDSSDHSAAAAPFDLVLVPRIAYVVRDVLEFRGLSWDDHLLMAGFDSSIMSSLFCG